MILTVRLQLSEPFEVFLMDDGLLIGGLPARQPNLGALIDTPTKLNGRN
jgi:hypothetical protein